MRTDMAKETYRNATLGMISLLHVVKGQADESLAVHSRLDDLLIVSEELVCNRDNV